MVRHPSRLARLLAAGVLTLSVVGTASASNHAMVRVLHASPDAPAVDVYLDDTPVQALTNVPFGTVSGYLEVPAGAHNVKVYATGDTTTPVIDADVTLAAGAMYTVAATNALASIEAQVIVDAPAASCDGAQVRVVHLSADAPAVDVATAGAAPADAVVKSLEYPDPTGYLTLPAGSYDLDVRLAGTTTVALAIPDVALAACTSYSVFAVGSAATPAVGGNALQVVLAVDATVEAAQGAGTTPPPTDSAPTTGVPSGSEPSATGPGLPFAALAALGGVVLIAASLRSAPVRRGRD
ncbi:MAG TPA: DUF4397 domain-containing protein [Candidatus Limnocylindrales bacterium]|nr:DUF4397 domain-containing protein [Candidatus Limnocylindrales bacterium]